MLNKTSSFFFLQGVPASCLCVLCLQRCCWSPWHGKPCTRLLTAKVPSTGLALPHPHSSGSVTQQGAANKSPHHGRHFYQVPLAFLELQAGVVLPPETGVPTPPRGSWTAAVCLKAQLFPSLTWRVCGCQWGSAPTSVRTECGRTKLCRHHWKKNHT